MLHFVKESVFPVSRDDLFAFHERADAFERLLPPWQRNEVIRPPSGLEVGTRVELRTRIGPFWIPIVAEHVAYDPGRSFEDVMVRGPFAHWHHRHVMLDHPDGSVLRDEIDYLPKGGFVGRWLDGLAIRPQLRRLFDFRHDVTRRELTSRAG